MARELYTRDINDPNYQPGLLEVDDELEMLIGQIKMILLTAPGEVLGSPQFGIDLEGKLFDTSIDENQLKRDILNQVREYCHLAFKYNVQFEIKFFKGSVRDACLIDIIINEAKILGILVQ